MLMMKLAGSLGLHRKAQDHKSTTLYKYRDKLFYRKAGLTSQCKISTAQVKQQRKQVKHLRFSTRISTVVVNLSKLLSDLSNN